MREPSSNAAEPGKTRSVSAELVLAENAGTIQCRRVLREIPGKRCVYDAVLDNQRAIAKVFSQPRRAQHHAERESERLAQMAELSIAVPDVLFSGRLEDGRHVLVTGHLEADPGSLPVPSPVNDTNIPPGTFRVTETLADLHAKGVLQDDLHLGNFLISGNHVYLLDPAQVSVSTHPVSRSRSLEQLAMLLALYPNVPAEAKGALCSTYAAARDWELTDRERDHLEKRAMHHVVQRTQRRLKKYLRSNTRHLHVKTARCDAMLDRQFLGDTDPRDFLEHLDERMLAGTWLKSGNTCSVARAHWHDQTIVIKRYNNKGGLHSARHTMKGSRAKWNWLHSHRLLAYGIPTPEPLAFVDNLSGPVVSQSYIITRYVEGTELRDFLTSAETTGPQREETAAAVRRILELFARYRISHGDLKHRNILVTANGPTVIDLDGMNVHSSPFAFALRRKRDLERFAKNWIDHPELAALFEERKQN